MARPKSATRKIGNHTKDQMKEALKEIQKGKSIRKVAEEVKIPFTTLRRYYSKLKAGANLNEMSLVPNYNVNQVFSVEQEEHLKNYFEYCALMFYGLSTKECRKVAFEMARINNLKMPNSWIEKKLAGKDWLKLFRSRHPELSIRRPEPCSLARATAFNRTNVNTFYNNLENLLKRNSSFADGTRIYNLDETSTTTVQRPQKVIAPKGRKSLGKVTSGEKGTLVTTCCIISAAGSSLPPVMVFPRKNFKDHMIKNTPPATLGLAAPSGWMNSELFPEVMKHFIRHSGSSKENPTILIMDNHESHLSIETLDVAKANGVHVLTLPPHTSGKLQPLDVGIFSPFKTYYNAAMESWMLQHPGKPVSIYDVGEMVGIAFLKSMTPSNIINAFKKCGIYPFDRNQFDDLDFMPSMVTDRPCPDCSLRGDNENEENQAVQLPTVPRCSHPAPIEVPQLEDHLHEAQQCISPRLLEVSQIENSRRELTKHEEAPCAPLFSSSADVSLAGPSCTLHEKSPAKKSTSGFVSPFQFRDVLKAGPRQNKRNRKPGRSLIATDTPEKYQIEQAKKKTIEAKAKKDVQRKVLQSDTEEEEDEELQQLTDDDGDYLKENKYIDITENDLKHPLSRPAKKGEYVLIQFSTKKKKNYYVGKVLETRNEAFEYFISFLRLKSVNKFYMPNVPDLSFVREEDVKLILPPPSFSGCTTRQQSYFYFSISFSLLNVN